MAGQVKDMIQYGQALHASELLVADDHHIM